MTEQQSAVIEWVEPKLLKPHKKEFNRFLLAAQCYMPKVARDLIRERW